MEKGKKIIGEIINLKQGIVKKLEEPEQGPGLIFLRIENSEKECLLNQPLSREITEDGLSLDDKVQIAMGNDGEILQVVKMNA